MKPSFLLLSLLPAICAMAQDTLKFSDITEAPGSVFLWPVELEGPSPVVGVQFDLVYPAGQLNPSSALPAENSFVLAAAREIAPGRARIAVSSTRNLSLAKDAILTLPLSLPATSPAGGPSFSVENIILALEDGSTRPASLSFGPLTTWRSRHFTAAELEAGRLIGDDADPDGDGASNLMEYAVGGNPRQSLPGEGPSAGFGVIFEAGQRKLYLAMNYRQALNAPGILFQPEVSEDLLQWRPGGETLQAGTGNQESVPLQTRVLVSEKRQQFLRLKVIRSPR